MKTFSLKIGFLGMFVFVITVFIVIPFACAKLNELLKLPSFITHLDIFLGIILLIIGTTIALWCVVLFLIIGKGTASPLHPPEKLIIKGLYKYTRNPMMLGVWIMLIGEAFILHSFMLLLFTVFVGIPAGVFFVIKYEEPDLEKRFGDEYLEYKKRVPRWILNLKKSNG